MKNHYCNDYVHDLILDDQDIARFRRLQHTLSDKMTELYLLFYSHVLHYFVRLNLFLQREEPVIAVVYEQVISSTCIDD